MAHFLEAVEEGWKSVSLYSEKFRKCVPLSNDGTSSLCSRRLGKAIYPSKIKNKTKQENTKKIDFQMEEKDTHMT